MAQITIVKQLQQRLKNWASDRPCAFHKYRWQDSKSQGCIYDEQGQLVELHLRELGLMQVPPEVWQCSSLQKLCLVNNQFSELPAEMSNLSALQVLDLSNNQFSTLPAVVSRLSTLRELYLSKNRLSELPAEMGNLSALQGLHLGSNQFSTLPAEMSNLSALQVLDLNYNQFRTLPAVVNQLSALQVLDLNYNRLSELPAEMSNLSALQVLDLSNNQFSTLPAVVSRLSTLQQLNLDNNQLSTLPVEMSNLSALRWLNLNNNQLSTLPVEMGNISTLRELYLDNNPLQSHLPDIIEQGVSALLAYLRTLQPIKIFYCYAHEDRALRDLIDKHLSGLKRQGHVVVWYDREIQAGMEWKHEIERRLSMAHIILLLVSADFMSSDYCYGREMQRALEMHKQGEVYVLPILLRPVDWQDAPFAKLQILPTGALSITEWQNQDKALADVAQQIRVVVTTLRTRQG